MFYVFNNPVDAVLATLDLDKPSSFNPRRLCLMSGAELSEVIPLMRRVATLEEGDGIDVINWSDGVMFDSDWYPVNNFGALCAVAELSDDKTCNYCRIIHTAEGYHVTALMQR